MKPNRWTSTNPVFAKNKLEQARRFEEVITPLSTNEVYTRVGFLFVLLFAFAALGWQVSEIFGPAVAGVITAVSLIATLGLSFVVMGKFMRGSLPGAGIAVGNSIVQGIFVGAISKVFESIYPGVVLQATLATLAVSGVVYILYRTGKFRTSPRGRKIFYGLLWGYLAFAVLNFILTMTGVAPGPFGVRSVSIMGIPLGLIIGLVAVGLAVYSMVISFEIIQEAIDHGTNKKLAWYAGYGLVVNVVWLYIEILRILSILRGSNN